MSNKYIKLILCSFIIIQSLNAQIYATYQSDTIVVTGSRIPSSLAEISRNIKIIDKQQIEQLDATSINDLLAKNVMSGIQTRGTGGVQADLHLRGAGFNQVLVLIDGIKVNDPQTGHHNLNLPLTIKDIEKIEVLKGAGSRLYGPHAMGGVINIITRKSSQSETNIKVSRGQNNYLNKTLSVTAPLGKTVNRLSYANRSSDGYRHNTDYQISTLFYRSAINLVSGNYKLTAGFTEKDFGANQFYTPGRFPDQREKIRVIFAGFHHYYKRNWGNLRSKISWRRHQDKFVLDHTLDPLASGYYQNKHRTNLYHAEMQANLKSTILLMNFGFEIGRESIVSNSLDNHVRDRFGLYFEANKTFNNLSVSTGMSVFFYSSWDWNFLPGLNITYHLTDQFKLKGAIEKSFSPPTFTNLYYDSPANKGNPGLLPEEAWSFELGLEYNKQLETSIDLFLRDNINIIDYAWNRDDSLYRAQNTGGFKIYGSEFTSSASAQLLNDFKFLNNLGFTYTWMDVTRKPEYKSKYAFNFLQSRAILTLGHSVINGMDSFWNVNFINRVNCKRYFLVDWNVSYRINSLRFNLGIDNIFDTKYKEFGYLPMPGRWIKAGIELQIKS